MTLEGTIAISAQPERVWAFLLDPQEMKACLPYCESLEPVGGDSFRAVVKVKVSAIQAHFTLKTVITEKRPFTILRMRTEGEDRGLASTLKQENFVELTPTPDGGTSLHYRVQVDVTGRLGKLGLTVLMGQAKKMAAEFVRTVKHRVEVKA